MSIRSLMLAPLLAVALAIVSAGPGSAQRPYSHAIFDRFITALNRGDTATAAQYLAPDFTLTWTDGTTWRGPDALQALASLGTPVTVISVAPAGNAQLSAVLQFGSSAPVAVTITGEQGTFGSLTVTGPAS